MERQSEMKARVLAAAGVDISACTASGWLDLAVEAEADARACGPDDPAYEHLVTLAGRYLDAAALREINR